MKKFRIWHHTKFGIGCETRKAKSLESLIIPKWIIKRGLIEIEELED